MSLIDEWTYLIGSLWRQEGAKALQARRIHDSPCCVSTSPRLGSFLFAFPKFWSVYFFGENLLFVSLILILLEKFYIYISSSSVRLNEIVVNFSSMITRSKYRLFISLLLLAKFGFGAGPAALDRRQNLSTNKLGAARCWRYITPLGHL